MPCFVNLLIAPLADRGLPFDPSRLLKKTHMLRCAQSPRYNVLAKYASARRFFARLASEIFLSSLQSSFSATC